MTPAHAASAAIHAAARMHGRKMGTFGTRGGDPEARHQPRSAMDVQGPTAPVRQAGIMAERNVEGGNR